MNLKQLGANRTEVEMGKYRVLFSYQTPVAYKILGLSMVYVTEKFWSRTTSKHIGQWLGSFQYDAPTVKVPQQQIDDLMESVK